MCAAKAMFAVMITASALLFWSAEAQASYTTEVLADNPLLYWRFSETSGTTAADSSGNSQSGTINGSPTLTYAGPSSVESGNNAHSFTASGQYVRRDGAVYPTGTSARTLEAWVRLSSSASQGIILATGPFNSSGTGAGSQVFALAVTPASGGFKLYATAWSNDMTSSDIFSANAWHHLVITFANNDGAGKMNPTDVKGYIDGTPVTWASYANGAINTTGSVVLGDSQGSSWFATGALDELAIYGTALSPARIAAHYNPPVSATWTGGASDGGNWVTADNWNPAATVGAVTDATVTSTGGTAYVSAPGQQAKSLAVNSGGAVAVQSGGNLQVATSAAIGDAALGSGSLTVNNGGTFGASTLTLTAGSLGVDGNLTAGTLYLNGGSATSSSTANLIVTSAMTVGTNLDMNGGTLTATGAAVTINPGSTLTIQKALSAATLNINGSLARTGVAAGAKDITVTSAMIVGTNLDMNGGTLTATGAAVTINSGATLTVDQPLSAATLNINGALVRVGAGAGAKDITVTTALNLSGSGNSLDMTGATLTASGATVGTDFGTSLTLSDGTISTLNVGGTAGISGGTITSLTSTGTINVSGGSITTLHTVAGTTTVTAGTIGTLDAAGTTVNLNSTARNVTTLNVAGATVYATNSGLATNVNVSSGYLSLQADTAASTVTLSGGTAATDSGKQITLDGSLTIAGDKRFSVTGGTVGVSGSNIRTARTLDLSGGTVTAENLVQSTSYIMLSGSAAHASTEFKPQPSQLCLASNVVDGTGMTTGDLKDTDWTHMWVNDPNVAAPMNAIGNQWLYVDLGSVHTLGQLKVWNDNEGNHTGVQYADLYYATVDPGLSSGQLFDPSHWTLFQSNQHFNDVVGGVPSPVTDTFNLNNIQARYFAIKVISNWGRTTYVGLGQLRFYDALAGMSLADTDFRVSADTTLSINSPGAITAGDLVFADLGAELDLSGLFSTLTFDSLSLDPSLVLHSGTWTLATWGTGQSVSFNTLPEFSVQGWTGNYFLDGTTYKLALTQTGGAIPEPATLGLIGLALLAIRRRRS